MPTVTKPITAEELFELGDIGRCELIHGEIIRMAPAGAEHGDIALEIGRLIGNHVKQHRLGKVYAAETGFTVAKNPDTTRAPDVAFVRADRVPKTPRRGFFDGPPDLAVEVVSPSDTHSDLAGKVQFWLVSGVTSVWVVDPPNKSMDVYRSDKSILHYGLDDELRDEPLLPGLILRVRGLFEE